MKKHLFLVAALMLSLAMSAEVRLTETFNYTTGAAIGDVEGWTTTGDITSGDGRLVSDVVLTYSNEGGEYILSGEGKSLKHNYASNKTNDKNGTQYVSSHTFTKVESTVYLSYIYKPDGLQTQANGELLGLTSGSSPSARPWTGKMSSGTTDGSVYRFGLTRQSGTSSDIVWGTTSYAYEETVFLVLKYEINETDTIASLFINPLMGTTEEPTADLVAATDGVGRKNINAIMFRNQGASKANYYISGVRVSTTWAEAVEAKSDVVLPALDAPVVGAASAIGAEEFTANWTAVENATGYKVNVYAGSSVIATQNVEGQAKTSATFYNTPVATELTYTVIAIGDGENYDDSEASEASAAFNTLTAPAAVAFIPSNAEWAEFAKDKGAYSAGSFPTTRDNGYDFVQAYIELSKDEDGKSFGIVNQATGERFTARALVDKQKDAAYLALPAVNSAVRADIYATAGTADKKMKVQQYNYSTNKWDDLQELTLPKENVEMVSVTPNAGVVKLRLLNSDSSGKQVWKVVTYAAAPTTLAAPVVGEATEMAKDGFTINWAAVANALGYRVLVTSADTTIRETVHSEVLAMAINQLKPNTEYTVKVAAIGDDAAYVGSVLSEAKVVTTLVDPDDPTAIDEVKATAKARKVVVDGQMLIERNGEYFNLTGTRVK